MSLLGALTSRQEPKNLTTLPWQTGADVGWHSATWAGSSVSTSSSLQLLTVYGCNRFICDGISTLPVGVFTKRNGVSEELETPGIIEEPAAGLGRIEWSTQFLTSELLGGDFFGLRVRRGATLTGVIPLDPTCVQVTREQGRKVFWVDGFRLSDFEVLHVPAIMWPGADRGLSPVEHAKQSIGLGLSSQEYAARYFGDDPTPPGVIETDHELTPDVAREIARSWSRAHSGKSKRALPGVLQGGAKWKPTLVNNEQAQFLETRKFTATEIASQMFLIDPVEMGLPVEGTSLTYSNQEERNARRVQVTFLPWIVRLERALSSLLPDGQYVKVNVNGLLRGDTKTRIEGYKVAIDSGFMTVEQVRELEDWAPLPDKAPTPPSLTEQIEAVGQLIRAGFDPAASLAFLGLPPIEHTGLTPITVTDDTSAPAPQGGPPS